MIRTICSRTSSDYKRLTKHENEDAQWIIARSENVCDKPIDIGKNIFHVVALGSDGTVVQRVRFRRDTLLQFFQRAEPATVGMESCAGSQWIARKIQALGHKVRLIPASL